MSAASGSASKGPSQVAYGIALAAALSVEDPFMQTDNLQVSRMVTPLCSGRRARLSACAPHAPAQKRPLLRQTGVCSHLAEHVNTAASGGAHVRPCHTTLEFAGLLLP